MYIHQLDVKFNNYQLVYEIDYAVQIFYRFFCLVLLINCYKGIKIFNYIMIVELSISAFTLLLLVHFQYLLITLVIVIIPDELNLLLLWNVHICLQYKVSLTGIKIGTSPFSYCFQVITFSPSNRLNCVPPKIHMLKFQPLIPKI